MLNGARYTECKAMCFLDYFSKLKAYVRMKTKIYEM